MERNNSCSIIVTHNRKKLLFRNIKRNLSQTVGQDIIIIDNASTDGTGDLLSERGLLGNKRIKYIHNENNEFGAGGFHIGLEYAFDHGYNSAWLMDDDGFPMRSDALEKLLEASDFLDRKDWILNATVEGSSYSLAFELGILKSIQQLYKWASRSGKTIYENCISPFNGTLISRDTFERIGNVKKEFVIHGDEAEYRERAINEGIFVGTVIDSLFFHPRKLSREYFFNATNGWFLYRQPWMEYYETRNHICIRKWYMGDEAVGEYIDNIRKKIVCAPYDVKEYEKYLSMGIKAGLEEDFTPLPEHPTTYQIDDTDKSGEDKRAERYSRLFSLLEIWMNRKELGLNIADDLTEREIKSVAVYGMGELGQHTVKELKNSNIEIVYVIDRNSDADSYGYKLISPDDNMGNVDAVIVTVLQSAPKVRRLLAEKLPEAEIIDIEELL